ncbi:hypothetical protein DITRI_Ditri10aG0078300 [Diplodiscus trichospermus]
MQIGDDELGHGAASKISELLVLTTSSNLRLMLMPSSARFLEAVVAYKKKIRFNGPLSIEPKPQEPTK